MKYFITSFFLIGSLYFNTISLYATNGRSFEEQTSKRIRSTATYHNKIKGLSKKIDTSTWGRPSHITVLGTLLLLAAHFQPVGVNQRSFTHSPTITSHGTIEASSDNLRTNNGTVCEVGARALGAKQAHIFTLLERHSSHSGHFIKDRNVTTVKEIKRERLKDFEQFAKNLVGEGKLSEEASQEEIHQLYKERQPAFSRVYTFNGSPVDAPYSQMIAQTHYKNTLIWIKKTIVPQKKPFHHLKTDKMIEFLVGINYRLLGEKKAPPSPFREGPVVIWNDAIGVPNFNEPTRMRGYLKNSPTELELYNKLCTLLEKQKGEEALSSTDEWDIFMINNIFKDKESPYLPFVRQYYGFNDFNQQEIKAKLREAMNSYKENFSKDPLKAAATLHLDIINIHPFEDANGRVTRLFMNIGLKSAGYPAVIIYDRDEYVRIIRQALKQENPGIFVDYIKAQIFKQVELYNNPEFKEGHALKEIADECMFDCSQTFFEASKKFGL